MIYSVWNQGRRLYDYYEAPGNQEVVNAPAPKHLRQTKLGLVPSQAAWPLPPMARKVGSGEVAKGRVAAPGGGLALGDVADVPLVFWGLLLLGGWWLWRKSK